MLHDQTTQHETNRIFLLKTSLHGLYMLDQYPRYAYSKTPRRSLKFLFSVMAFVSDKLNRLCLSHFIKQHGWPNRSIYGARAAAAAFYIVQHSPPDFMMRYYPLLKQAVCQNEASRKHLAYCIDRLLMHRGKLQLFGSQIKCANGQCFLWPVFDRTHVDARRKTMELSPIAVFAKRLE